jgi:hypothetical protein
LKVPKISLADFVDIVSKSGTPKATKVAQIKNRPKYEPATDFYKPIREFLIDVHKTDQGKFSPEIPLALITDPKKLTNYPGVISGYLRWWGNKELNWFEPSVATFSAHGVDVAINPELGLIVNGTRYLIKLYFKSEALAKTGVDIVTHLMEMALRPQCDQGEIMAVLDTRRARLICPTVPIPRLGPTLGAELAYVAALWDSI